MSLGSGPIIAGLAAVCCAQLAAAQVSGPPADATDVPQLDGAHHPEFYRLVKRFDFDERALGNYEDTPLYWTQLRGPGLPTLYARGQIDDDVGHEAAPSFRLDIQTGNVAYECRHPELAVGSSSDYLLIGYVRAENLRYARAFVAAYFIDRFGQRIPGSARVSQLVAATGRQPEPWQRVQLALPGDFPTADALRIQFWILQNYTWRERDPAAVDPIVRRDVYASAWFDDFTLYQTPRLHLRFSEPGGLVLPGEAATLIVEANNAGSQPLNAELNVTDGAGQVYQMDQIAVPAWPGPGVVSPSAPASEPSNPPAGADPLATGGSLAVEVAVPELPPGFYQAHLALRGGSETLLERTLNFVVLPDLPPVQPRPDLGVDLGCWQHGPTAGVQRLLSTLGCGAAKLGLPMLGELDTPEKSAYFRQLGDLLRELASHRIDVTGVILSPSAGTNPEHGDSTRDLVSRGSHWRRLANPIFAACGAMVPTWQLGAEPIELRDSQPWTAEQIERVRTQLRGFVTIPRLAIPQPITAVEPYRDDVVSVWVPGTLPTRALPRHLGFLVQAPVNRYWLALGPDPHRKGDTHRARDLARRLVLAKALNPGRIFVPAPFELSERPGRPTWQPTADYLVLRTMFHFLTGKTPVAVMRPLPETLAVLFDGGESSGMVIWSWRERPLPKPVELYLGPQPRATDIWGQPVALEVVEGRTRLPVGPTPLLVEALHTPLALLQASYQLAPTCIRPHDPLPRPVLTFRNSYHAPMLGEVRLTPPANWQVEPARRAFSLAPGETFRQPLTLTLPPRQIAASYDLDVQLLVHAPEAAELRFREPLSVGLPEIELKTTAYWQGDDLIVEQSLRNFSDETVSFAAFCEPPGWARAEGEFLDVPPGAFAHQTYVFPDSRDALAGTLLHVGIQEIDGPRTLNQFAEVPQ